MILLTPEEGLKRPHRCGSCDGGATWSRLREFPGERIHLIFFDAGLCTWGVGRLHKQCR